MKRTKKGKSGIKVLSALIIMTLGSSLFNTGLLGFNINGVLAANDGDSYSEFSSEVENTEPSAGYLEPYQEDSAFVAAVTSVGSFVPSSSTFDAKYMSGGFVLKNNPVEGTDYNFVCKADDYFASDLYRSSFASSYKLSAKAKTVYFDMYNNFRYYDQSAGAYKYCDVRYEVSYDYSTFSMPSTVNAYKPGTEELYKDSTGGIAHIEDITGWLTYGTTKDNIASNGKGSTWYRSFKSGERTAAIEVGTNDAGVFGLHNAPSALVSGMSTTVKATFYPSGTLKSFKDSRTVSESPVSVKGYCIFNDLDYHEGIVLGTGFKEAKLWGTAEITKWGKVKSDIDDSDLLSDFDSTKRKVVDEADINCSNATTSQATTLEINSDGWVRGTSTKGDKFNYTSGNAGYLSQCAFASFEGSSISYCYKITPIRDSGTTRDWHVYGKLIVNTDDRGSSDNRTADYRTNKTYTDYSLPNWDSSLTSIVTVEPLNSNIKYVLVDATNSKTHSLADFDSTGLIGNPATVIPIEMLKSNAVSKAYIEPDYLMDTNYYSDIACTSKITDIAYPSVTNDDLTVYVKATSLNAEVDEQYQVNIENTDAIIASIAADKLTYAKGDTATLTLTIKDEYVGMVNAHIYKDGILVKDTDKSCTYSFEITKNTDIKVVYDAVDVTGPAIRPYGVTIIVNQKFDALALFKGYIDSNPGTYRVKVRKQGGSASVTSSSIVKGTKAGTVSLYLQRKEKVGKKNKWVTDTDAYEAVVTIVKCKIPSIRRSMNDIGTTIDLKQLVDNIPSDANISWDIKNPKNKVVASVNSDGVITLQNKGKATIRLTISYGGYSKTVSGKLTVK